MGIFLELGFAILVFPIVALCALIYFAIRCAFQPKSLSPSYLFPGEKGENLKEVLASLEEVERDIARIRAAGQDLDLRADGLFDARNSRGRRLNKVLEPAYELMEAATAFRSELEQSAQELLDNWNFNRTGRSCSTVAVVVYLVVAVIASLSTSGFAVLAISGISSVVAAALTLIIKAAMSEDDLSAYMPSEIGPKESGQRERIGDDEAAASTAAGAKKPREKKDCFEILGLKPGASTDEIKAAYRDAIKQYHPDYVASLGVELREVAERKTKELNAAYREALSR
jgi:DnaJ domain